MSDQPRARWRTLLSEPFVQFLILGLLLFAGHAVWQRAQSNAASTIVVDPEEMQRRAILFAGENKRNPTEDELQALIYDYVQEEALVREGKRLGLDQGDTIIRRRIAQKVRFMLEDTVDVEAPDRETLCAFLKANPERFAQPATRSFSHIFISPEGLDNAALDRRAVELLARSKQDDWQKLGDPFLLKRSYKAADIANVAKAFGPAFAQKMFTLDAKQSGFQGPVESAFGLHLVRIDAEGAAVAPKCDAILDKLEAAYRIEQREKANVQSVQKIVEQYEIVVDE